MTPLMMAVFLTTSPPTDLRTMPVLGLTMPVPAHFGPSFEVAKERWAFAHYSSVDSSTQWMLEVTRAEGSSPGALIEAQARKERELAMGMAEGGTAADQADARDTGANDVRSEQHGDVAVLEIRIGGIKRHRTIYLGRTLGDRIVILVVLLMSPKDNPDDRELAESCFNEVRPLATEPDEPIAEPTGATTDD